MTSLGQTLVNLERFIRNAGEEPQWLSYVYRELKVLTLTDFYTSLRQDITPSDEALLQEIAKRLANHEPAQYILGYEYFGNLRISVDRRVLIPRPETLELVEWVLTRESGTKQVLDLGTGSGAIAISLKKAKPDWQISASDISEDALLLAKENADRHHLAITFCQSDVFDSMKGYYDVIIANPPYIALSDIAEVGQNVLAFEPHLALFAKEEGLAIHRKILAGLTEHLTPNGALYLEIGYKQGKSIQKLVSELLPGFSILTKVDSYGKDRMVVITRD